LQIGRFQIGVAALRYTARLDEEYAGKLTLDTTLLNLPKPERVTTPLLVLGAEDDGCFTQKEVRATAHAYRTEAEIFPDMGHDMMLEPKWAAVAERIHAWLGTHDLLRDHCRRTNIGVSS
jgi:alpha-beta hydrolase superfamily lysophospholipase